MTKTTDLHTIRDEFRDNLGSIEAALAVPLANSCTVIRRDFVVVGANGPINFRTMPDENGTVFPVNIGLGLAHQIERFHAHDAVTLADHCRASAMHWRTAAEAQAETLRNSLAILDRLPCATPEKIPA